MRDYESFFIRNIRLYFDKLFDNLENDLAFDDDHDRDLSHEQQLKFLISQAEKNGTLSLETAAGLCEDIDSFGKVFDDQVKHISHLKRLEKSLDPDWL